MSEANNKVLKRQLEVLISILLHKKAVRKKWTALAPPGGIEPSTAPRRSPRGAVLTPCKAPKILEFTGFSEVLLSINSRPKPANFSWFFAFLLAGY